MVETNNIIKMASEFNLYIMLKLGARFKLKGSSTRNRTKSIILFSLICCSVFEEIRDASLLVIPTIVWSHNTLHTEGKVIQMPNVCPMEGLVSCITQKDFVFCRRTLTYP